MLQRPRDQRSTVRFATSIDAMKKEKCRLGSGAGRGKRCKLQIRDEFSQTCSRRRFRSPHTMVKAGDGSGVDELIEQILTDI